MSKILLAAEQGYLYEVPLWAYCNLFSSSNRLHCTTAMSLYELVLWTYKGCNWLLYRFEFKNINHPASRKGKLFSKVSEQKWELNKGRITANKEKEPQIWIKRRWQMHTQPWELILIPSLYSLFFVKENARRGAGHLWKILFERKFTAL